MPAMSYAMFIFHCMFNWMLPLSAGTETSSRPGNIVITCPYKCGVNRICDPGTNQCISCQRYCHTRLSEECDRKCLRFVSPHGEHHKAQEYSTKLPVILDPYFDSLSAHEQSASGFQFTIWILGTITAFSVLALATIIIVVCLTQQRQKLNRYNERQSNHVNPNRIDKSVQTSLFNLVETVSASVNDASEEYSVVSLISPQRCTQSNTSINGLLHKCTLNESQDTSEFISESIDTTMKHPEPYTMHDLSSLQHLTDQPKLQRSKSDSDTRKTLNDTSVLRQTKSIACQFLSSLWKRMPYVGVNHVSLQNSGNSDVQSPGNEDTELKTHFIPPKTDIKDCSAEPTIRKHDFRQDDQTATNSKESIHHLSINISSHVIDENSRSSNDTRIDLFETKNNYNDFEHPQCISFNESEDIVSSGEQLGIEEKLLQHTGSSYNAGTSQHELSDFEKPVVRPFSTNLISSNMDIHDSSHAPAICQPTEGRHYDGNGSLSNGSLGIHINLEGSLHTDTGSFGNRLLVCQPSDAQNDENNEQGAVGGLVGSIEDHHSLPDVDNNDDNDSNNVSYIPRSITDDSAMASVYDPAFTNRDGFHLAHFNNNPIYEHLQGIQWVMGYHSEGRSISVYADLDVHDVNELEQQLVDTTGLPANKFKLRQNAPM